MLEIEKLATAALGKSASHMSIHNNWFLGYDENQDNKLVYAAFIGKWTEQDKQYYETIIKKAEKVHQVIIDRKLSTPVTDYAPQQSLTDILFHAWANASDKGYAPVPASIGNDNDYKQKLFDKTRSDSFTVRVSDDNGLDHILIVSVLAGGVIGENIVADISVSVTDASLWTEDKTRRQSVSNPTDDDDDGSLLENIGITVNADIDGSNPIPPILIAGKRHEDAIIARDALAQGAALVLGAYNVRRVTVSALKHTDMVDSEPWAIVIDPRGHDAGWVSSLVGRLKPDILSFDIDENRELASALRNLNAPITIASKSMDSRFSNEINDAMYVRTIMLTASTRPVEYGRYDRTAPWRPASVRYDRTDPQWPLNQVIVNTLNKDALR